MTPLSAETVECCVSQWREGIEEFNQGRYWEAHERWEHRWNRLPPPWKDQIQGLILACGALHLIGRGRFDAAQRLCRRSLQGLDAAENSGLLASAWPCLEIPRLREFLTRAETALSGPGFDEQGAHLLLEEARRLRVRLREG